MDNQQQIQPVEEPLSLSSDIKRACELLEKLQKSKYCGEVPATKLAALQKVLQSDFLTAVREVYEHIYETVDIEGREEHMMSKVIPDTDLPQALRISAPRPLQRPRWPHSRQVKATPTPGWWSSPRLRRGWAST